MRLKSLKELLGSDVLVQEERIGALYDVYLDRDSNLVRYLVVATAPRGHLLVTAGIAMHEGRAGVRLALSRAQLECGAGAWPLHAANAWLQHWRVCRGTELLNYRAEAQDGSAGRLLDILIDDEAWSVDYVVVDARPEGGAGKVLVPLQWVASIDVARGALRVRRTRAELAESPPA
jgi:sporulation protein YlmC with PRC-barrel domain